MLSSWTQEWVHNCGNRPCVDDDGSLPEPEVKNNDGQLGKSVNYIHDSALSTGGLYEMPRPVGLMSTKPVAWQGPLAANCGRPVGYVSKATHDRAPDKLGDGSARDTSIGEMEESGLMVDTGTCFAGGVSVRLENMELWQAFSNVGTEMVINRSGRRMFPFLSLDIRGLQSNTRYSVGMRIVPADNLRYKFTNARWFPVAKAGERLKEQVYLHPDSPNSCKHWLKKKVSFPEVKITNNKEGVVGHLVLQSMCKYMVEVLIESLVEKDGSEESCGEQLIFPLPLTTFMAVTAYQNEEMVKMKIRKNPFAKAFRANIANDGAFYDNPFAMSAIKPDLPGLCAFRDIGEDPSMFAHAPLNFPQIPPPLQPLQPLSTNLPLAKLLHLPPHTHYEQQLLAANYMLMMGGIPHPLPVHSSLGLQAFDLKKPQGLCPSHHPSGVSGGPVASAFHDHVGRENAAPYSSLPGQRCLASRLSHKAAGLMPILPMYHSLSPFMFRSYDALASSSSSSSDGSGMGSLEYSGLAGPYMYAHHP